MVAPWRCENKTKNIAGQSRTGSAADILFFGGAAGSLETETMLRLRMMSGALRPSMKSPSRRRDTLIGTKLCT